MLFFEDYEIVIVGIVKNFYKTWLPVIIYDYHIMAEIIMEELALLIFFSLEKNSVFICVTSLQFNKDYLGQFFLF